MDSRQFQCYLNGASRHDALYLRMSELLNKLNENGCIIGRKEKAGGFARSKRKMKSRPIPTVAAS
jgi:hypothetical protein